MATVQMLLGALALICFLLGLVNAQPAASPRPINWVSAGLALLTLLYLIVKGA